MSDRTRRSVGRPSPHVADAASGSVVFKCHQGVTELVPPPLVAAQAFRATRGESSWWAIDPEDGEMSTDAARISRSRSTDVGADITVLSDRHPIHLVEPVDPNTNVAWVGALGPLVLEFRGEPITLGRRKARELLLLLLVHRGASLSASSVVDRALGGSPASASDECCPLLCVDDPAVHRRRRG